jgi:tetratricopeptide (TPR) repeat protein
LRSTWPAFVITAIFAFLTQKLTAATFMAGGSSPALYRLTQPWIALHYVRMALLPTALSADSDMTYVDPLSPKAMAGYLFVAAMLWAAYRTSERRETRPICFGILWYFIALAPTSLMVLADVTNDHRMFFPFAGLALAAFWSLRLLLQQHPEWIRAAIGIFAVVLIAEAAGTHQRNKVWHNEVTLWSDVAKKSPHNTRGLMAYATAQMRQGDFAHGLPYLERAAAMSPQDFLPAMNLGIAYGAVKRAEDADRQFQRAIVLAPNLWEPHFFYGRWLENQGRPRLAEAQRELETAVKMNRHSFEARNLLMQVYEETGNQVALEALAQDTLKLADEKLPGETEAPNALPPVKPAPVPVPFSSGNAEKDAAVVKMASEDLARQATDECRKGNYDECLSKAQQALKLRPDYTVAMNVVAMAQFATGHGDEGIDMLQQALRIDPNYETAKKNLAWALEERKKALEAGEGKKQ